MAMDIDKPQVLTGVLALCLGFMVCLLRSPGSAYFLPGSFPTLWPACSIPSYIRILTNGLPDFILPFAFALFTSGLISSSGRRNQLFICLGWLVLESFFESGRYSKDAYLRFIPPWFDSEPLLRNTKSFFLNGTFDAWDMLFILAGTVVAFCVMFIPSKRRREE
jgi:hypothetical protein